MSIKEIDDIIKDIPKFGQKKKSIRNAGTVFIAIIMSFIMGFLIFGKFISLGIQHPLSSIGIIGGGFLLIGFIMFLAEESILIMENDKTLTQLIAERWRNESISS